MPRILFAAGADRWPDYRAPLAGALRAAGIDAEVMRETDAPDTVDYIIYAPGGTVTDFSPYSNCKAVLNLWAGVEKIVDNPTLTQPLCRMVDSGLEEGMVEYVTGHVLRHHLGMDRYIGATGGAWDPVVPPLARDRTVAMLGLGALGQACARALVALNFNVLGWSRSPREMPGVRCHDGPGGLSNVLRQAEIAVLLLPLTEATENLMNSETLDLMPRGAILINPGRGALIDDAALLAALDSGQIAHATLDVFRKEPLPRDHPFQAHQAVTITPHIASETRPESAARVIAENVRRGEAGEPLLFQVDRNAGY